MENDEHPLIRLAVIYGSNREGRLCDAVVDWLRQRIEHSGRFQVDAIDPLALGLPDRHSRRPHRSLLNLRGRIQRADAFVVVTPEYNHGYPAALKHVIDSVHDGWQAKPVALAAYGGFSGGLRAIEQLRAVFAALDAVAIREALAIAMAWTHLDADRRLRPTAAHERAADALLTRLAWWAHALTAARTGTAAAGPAPIVATTRPAGHAILD